MHEFTTCLILWCKRYLRRPFFVFTLLLMPASVLFLQNCRTGKDAVAKVALYAPKNDTDRTAEQLIHRMVSLSNSAITFYPCASAEILKSDVSEGRAACGYVLPEKMDEKLREFTRTQKPYILAFRQAEDIRTRIVDEIVLSKLYQPLSYYRLENFLSEKQNTPPEEDWLRQTYEKHSSSELLFQFEYADGSDNAMLNNPHFNYMLMPVRGMVSVMVFLSCLSGGLFRYADQTNGLLLADRRKRQLCNLLSLLVPGIFSGAIGLIAIKMAGIFVSSATELPAMLLFVLCCMSLANLLCVLFGLRECYLAAIPVLVIGSLILSPVFVSIESVAPNLAPLSLLFPTTHYLSTVHTSLSSMLSSSSTSSISLILGSSIIAALYSRIKG